MKSVQTFSNRRLRRSGALGGGVKGLNHLTDRGLPNISSKLCRLKRERERERERCVICGLSQYTSSVSTLTILFDLCSPS